MKPQTSSADPVSIRLETSLGLSQIPSLLDHLLRALDTSEGLEFDLSAVSDIDIAGVQMLLILDKEASALGKEIAFVKPSRAVRELFACLGRMDFFDDRVLVEAR